MFVKKKIFFFFTIFYIEEKKYIYTNRKLINKKNVDIHNRKFLENIFTKI
jgi:hypothetical protein